MLIFKIDAFLFVLVSFLILKIVEAIGKYYILYGKFKNKKIIDLFLKLKSGEMPEVKEIQNILPLYRERMSRFMIFVIVSAMFIILISKEIFDKKFKYVIIGRVLFWNGIGYIGCFILIGIVYAIVVALISKKIKNEKIKILLS